MSGVQLWWVGRVGLGVGWFLDHPGYGPELRSPHWFQWVVRGGLHARVGVVVEVCGCGWLGGGWATAALGSGSGASVLADRLRALGAQVSPASKPVPARRECARMNFGAV